MHNVVGIAGLICILVAYFLLQAEMLVASGYLYSGLNALGAALVAFSLLFEFNLSAFVLEIFWLAISLYGLAKKFRRDREASPQNPA